jgi:hypothetical protein
LLFAGALLVGVATQAVPLHAQAIDSRLTDRTLGALRKACVDSSFGYLIQQLVLRSTDRMPNIGVAPSGEVSRLLESTKASGMTFRWFCPYSRNGGDRVTSLVADRSHV